MFGHDGQLRRNLACTNFLQSWVVHQRKIVKLELGSGDRCGALASSFRGRCLLVVRTECWTSRAPVAASRVLGWIVWCWSKNALAHCAQKSKAERTRLNGTYELLHNEAAGVELFCYTVPSGDLFADGRPSLRDALYRGGYIAFQKTYSEIECRHPLVAMLARNDLVALCLTCVVVLDDGVTEESLIKRGSVVARTAARAFVEHCQFARFTQKLFLFNDSLCRRNFNSLFAVWQKATAVWALINSAKIMR